MNQGQPEEYSLSPLQTFFSKVAIVTGALLILLYSMSYLVVSVITTQAQQSKILNGGPNFWRAVEEKLYAMADAPDIPPEKKKKIIDALHRLSGKYRPYIEALHGDGPSAGPDGGASR